jgi:8-oxo-dGTP pyrophosphatase MutT (NUDIX family)
MSAGPDVAARESAVLVPLFRDAAGALRLVIVRRSEGGVHGGQLAFPGGARAPADASLLETALREAAEEIGLPAVNVRVLSRLPDVEVRVSRYVVAPFLARIERPAAWAPDAREIAEVLEPRLSALLAPEARAFASDLLPADRAPMNLPYYGVGPHRLWGASERILNPLLGRILAGEWPELGPDHRA